MVSSANRKTVVWVAAVAIGISVPSSRGADRGTIAGVVKDASGKPAVGAMVKAKQMEGSRWQGLMMTAISQAGGQYTVPDLPPGMYSVQAWGGSFESAPKDNVTLDAEQRVAVNLDLTRQQDFFTGRTVTQWADLLPEEEGKFYIVSVCAVCHTDEEVPILRLIVTSRKDRAGWAAIFEKYLGKAGVPIGSLPRTLAEKLILAYGERDRNAAIDYLTKHYGPNSPPLKTNGPPPATWVTGPAAKAVWMEYKLPPKSGNPHDMAVDSKGIGWVGEQGRGVIGRLDPNTFTYLRFPLPGGKARATATAIVVDNEDRVWVTNPEADRMVRFDTKSWEFKSYPVPRPKPPHGDSRANIICFHPDGTVWYSGFQSNLIVRLDPATGKVTEYPVPAGVAANVNAVPMGIAVGGDQKVWFAERITDKVGRLDPATGKITEYDTPTRGGVLRLMTPDADGNLWYAVSGGVGKLAKVDYRTGQITEFPTPTKYSGPYSVDVDKKRNLIWVGEWMADQIARFDPRTQTWVEYRVPINDSNVRRIEVDRSRPNRIWFSGNTSYTAGYLDVLE